MLPPYLVCEFDKKTLSSLVRERFGDDFPNINKKRQIQYIYNYLKDLEAKTVLLESEYVDKDYLEDYSRYYVRCFNRYGERCARLHFFTHEFDSKDFQELLTNHGPKKSGIYKENYLGFVVIKPLPKTFIGKTCLKTYPTFSSSLNKNVLTQTYQVNLFGIDLEIESVAFQEQDKVVSACATTAIWSMYHAQQGFDTKKVPSCSAITLSAINHIVDSSNSFPNKGLTNKQILRAIDTQNLRNHKIELKNGVTDDQFIDLIKILTNSNIPAILGGDVYQKNGAQWQLSGSHAVTVLGFKNCSSNAIYIHDDRIGPFAKASIKTLDGEKGGIPDESIDWCITIQDKDDSGNWKSAQEIIVPDNLIISTNPKVRIPFDYIDNTCNAILAEWHRYCEEINTSESVSDIPFLEHAISLVNLSDFKADIIKNKNVSNKYEILTQGYARFLWSATFTTRDSSDVFRVIFDATDIPQGNAVSAIVVYQPDIFSAIREYFLTIEKATDHESDNHNFLSSFIRKLKFKNDGYQGYLNDKYGMPNAPRKIKSSEILNGNLPERTDIKIYYGLVNKKIEHDFPELMNTENSGDYRIWVISIEGALILGEEKNGMGHPTLTGFKAARIAGELRYFDGWWEINAKSGRYSKNYANSRSLLKNALEKFREIYSKEGNIRISKSTKES
jgi:hypothetical protein